MTSGCWIEALGVLITVPLFADSFQAMDLKRLYVTYIRQLYHPFLWVGIMKSSKIMGNPYTKNPPVCRILGYPCDFFGFVGHFEPPCVLRFFKRFFDGRQWEFYLWLFGSSFRRNIHGSFGFRISRISDVEWLVGRCSRYWNLQSSARYKGCLLSVPLFVDFAVLKDVHSFEYQDTAKLGALSNAEDMNRWSFWMRTLYV